MFEIDPKTEILVVSASSNDHFQIKMLLKQLGLTIVTLTDSGIEALNLCTKKTFKIVISDINVNHISGWLFLKEFKTSDKIPNCAAILKGKGDCPIPDALLKQFGVTNYLQVPFATNKLMAAIVSSLSTMQDSFSLENRYSEAKGSLIAKNGKQATVLYTALKDETRSSSRSCLGLAQAHGMTGNHAAAKRLVSMVIKKGDAGISATVMAIKMALHSQSTGEVKDFIEDLISSTDGSAFHFQSAGDECLKHEWAVDFAEQIFRQALDRGFRRPHIILGLAKASLIKGATKEALEQTRRVISSHHEFLEALNLEGVCLRKLGRLDEAKRCYEKALKLSPMDAKIYFNLALCAMAREGQLRSDLQEAERYLKTCVGISPSFQKAIEKLALVRSQLTAQVVDRSHREGAA